MYIEVSVILHHENFPHVNIFLNEGGSNSILIPIYPFQTNSLPLKRLESAWLSKVFRGIKRDHWPEMGEITVGIKSFCLLLFLRKAKCVQPIPIFIN